MNLTGGRNHLDWRGSGNLNFMRIDQGGFFVINFTLSYSIILENKTRYIPNYQLVISQMLV